MRLSSQQWLKVSGGVVKCQMKKVGCRINLKLELFYGSGCDIFLKAISMSVELSKFISQPVLLATKTAINWIFVELVKLYWLKLVLET